MDLHGATGVLNTGNTEIKKNAGKQSFCLPAFFSWTMGGAKTSPTAR